MHTGAQVTEYKRNCYIHNLRVIDLKLLSKYTEG